MSEDTTNAAMSPRRVLVVDDSPTIRMLYRAILEAAGYTVLLAKDGEVGLDMALRERPDLLLVDVVMPRMDGVTMLQELRACEQERGQPHLPALMFSALTDPLMPDPQTLQVQAVLDKSRLTPSKLTQIVRTVLEQAGE